jgi:hypothetical protein
MLAEGRLLDGVLMLRRWLAPDFTCMKFAHLEQHGFFAGQVVVGMFDEVPGNTVRIILYTSSGLAFHIKVFMNVAEFVLRGWNHVGELFLDDSKRGDEILAEKGPRLVSQKCSMRCPQVSPNVRHFDYVAAKVAMSWRGDLAAQME